MRTLAIAVLVAGLSPPSIASANGRPATTNGVQFRPGDRQSIYVATTFGLLISHDDGCSFRWICEDNIGYGGTFDPKYRVAADGSLFATTYTGLRVSRDGGCSFFTATVDRPTGDPGRIADRWIDAIDIGPTGEIWVATADNGKPNDIFRSTDNGLTFAPRGMLSPTIWWKSIRVAPTRAQRVYATGYQVAGTSPGGAPMAPTPHFRLSDDAGAQWAASPLAGVQLGQTPLLYVVGVDHEDPDIVVMMSAGANPPLGDRLYRSRDSGATWTEVLATQASILDVALTDAGGVLAVTLGGGAFASTDHGASFAAMTGAPQLACVGQRADGALYGCGADRDPDFMAVARAGADGRWDKVFRFVDLAGPLECPAGTVQRDACSTSQWNVLKEQFGAQGPAAGTCAEPAPDITPARSGGCCEAGRASGRELGGLGLLVLACARATLRRRPSG